MTTKLCWVLVVLAACGDDGMREATVDAPGGDDASGDAMHTIPVTIEVDRFGDPPTVLAFRSGSSGAWQALDPMATSFTVDAPTYQLLAVCPYFGRWQTAIAANATADAPSVYVPCSPYADLPPSPTVAVSGTMKQPGTVWIGPSATGTTANWTYTLDVTKGLHEVLAFDGSKWSFAATRDIQAPTTIDVDTATTGMPANLVPYTIHGGDGEATATQVDWLTDHELATIAENGKVAFLPPAAFVTPNDLIATTVHVGGATTYREVFAIQFGPAGGATEYTLLDPIVGATFAGTRASWTSAPTTDAFFSIAGTNAMRIRASRAYLAGATELAMPDVSSVPGWSTDYDVGASTTAVLDFSEDSADATVASVAVSGGAVDRQRFAGHIADSSRLRDRQRFAGHIADSSRLRDRLESRACALRPSLHCSSRWSPADRARSRRRN